MNALENEFLEEYLTVVKICSDMLGGNGVSSYIDEMNAHGRDGLLAEPNWNSKLKTLKHLRWLRNCMMHPENNECYEVTENDLSDLKSFHEDVLRGRDPLAVLNSYKKAKRSAAQQPRREVRTIQTFKDIENESDDSNGGYDERGWNGWVILLALGIILLIVFLASRAH